LRTEWRERASRCGGEANVGAEKVVEGCGLVEPGMEDGPDSVVEPGEADAGFFCGSGMVSLQALIEAVD
jgi:hypothetical protein